MSDSVNTSISNAVVRDHGHSHGHSHGPKHHRFYSTKTFRLVCMMILTFSFFIVELVVGNITNSLALVADAFHMLSDLIALIIALLAVRISKRRSDINTYGWVRGEVVGANINTVFLLALCLTIVFDVVKRYITPEPIENVNLLLIVGSTGLGINIIGLFLFQGFHGHSHAGHKGEHSHGTAAKSRKRKDRSDRRTNEESKSGSQSGNATVTQPPRNEDSTHDLEELRDMPGSSEFKRHSVRALEEVILLIPLQKA